MCIITFLRAECSEDPETVQKKRITFALAADDDVSENGEVNWSRHVSHASYQTVTFQANGLYSMVCELAVLEIVNSPGVLVLLVPCERICSRGNCLSLASNTVYY